MTEGGAAAYGRFFDGESGRQMEVAIAFDRAAGTLKLEHPDLPHGSQYWPLYAVRALADQARTDQLVLSLYDDGALDSDLITTARLTVSDPALVDLLPRLCPNLHKRDVKRGTTQRVVTYAGGAMAAFAIMYFAILPALASSLAAVIPVQREVAYGKTVVNQMERVMGGRRDGGLICTDPQGVEALDVMTARLIGSTDVRYELNVVVFDHAMVNAFAAPGGQIVLMRGLIEKADGPDEVAAVLAHEIGHVEARDVTRNALRVAGSAGLLSMVFGDFSGGSAALIVAEQLLNARYTREAEAQADRYALEMMQNANVDATALAGFFDKLSNVERVAPEIPVYLSSHPKTSSRADAARAFAREQGRTQQILSDYDWGALRDICEDRDVQNDDG